MWMRCIASIPHSCTSFNPKIAMNTSGFTNEQFVDATRQVTTVHLTKS